MTVAQLRQALDARGPLRLEEVLADLVERDEVEVSRYRDTPTGPLEARYVIPRN